MNALGRHRSSVLRMVGEIEAAPENALVLIEEIEKRYLAEFDFRYNERAALEVDDFTRTMRALLGIKGKRLTYKQGPGLEAQA